MSQPRSALAAIGSFGVAIAALSVVATASIVLATPDPPVARMTVAQAAAALRGRPTALRRSAAPPPDGVSAPLLQQTLARALGRPPALVRVVWLGSSPSRWSSSMAAPGRSATGVSSSPFVFRNGGVGIPTPEGFSIQMGQAQAMKATDPTLDRVILSMQQPPFAASVVDGSGRWSTVYPHLAILTGWRLKVLTAMAVSLLLLAPLAWLFARRFTRPFRALAAAIEADRDLPEPDGPRELRDAATAIAQLRARLADETDERMRMLRAVAHDLRTPLTSLKLRIEAVPEPQRTRMSTDTNRMAAMIAEVLRFARDAAATRVEVSVRSSVEEVLAGMPRHNGEVTLSPGPEFTVAVVEPTFHRALENLVRNAIDYAGGARVDVEENGREVVISVVDRGPGIAPADRERLLRPFERGDASRNRNTGGIGLGLSIVRDFAQLHGGSLVLTETLNGGATASLRLPI
jgi:signal transduction histidine kinase